MIVELNEDNFDSEIKNGIKLVEFYATWCIYCKKQRIELMNFENNDNVWIGIVDGDESPNILKRYKDRSKKHCYRFDGGIHFFYFYISHILNPPFSILIVSSAHFSASSVSCVMNMTVK